MGSNLVCYWERRSERHWVLHLVCYLETHSDRNLVYSKVIHLDRNSVCSKVLLKVLHSEKRWDYYLVCYLVLNWAERSGSSWEMLMVMSSVPCFLLDYHLGLMKERNFRTEIH